MASRMGESMVQASCAPRLSCSLLRPLQGGFCMQRLKIAFTICLGLAVMFVSSAALAQYQLTNLVSNQAKTAKFMDPLQVNGWGLARSSGGPFWVSDQGSGWSTLYTGKGVKEGLEVLIPSASGAGPGQPTGIVFNGTGEFPVQGWSAFFIFATLDGTISGWAPQSNPNDAIIAVNNSAAGASYTGLAITDSTLPAGYGPFGIQDINGLVYVSFALASTAPNGQIDIFQEDGTFVKTLAQGRPLNQPWGFAVAPRNFGALSNTLLVSNNTNSGTINA